MREPGPKYTFIDLFAGIGGFRLGLERAGGECLHFSEINRDAIHAYCTNFDEGEGQNLGDITRIKDLPPHDLLTAGVPCQSWSIAGRNLGFDDDRGQLWNDTLYLLNQSRPKAFIFENVKGLADPRNKPALAHILKRIREAGYFAGFHVLNSFDFGVPQNRVRIYIVGFLEKEFYLRFAVPRPVSNKVRLADIIEGCERPAPPGAAFLPKNGLGQAANGRAMSLSNNKGFNDYFLFNDIRNGHSTVHSWDIMEATERQKHLCLLLLKNRRKPAYGHLDGNPLSLEHFRLLDPSVRLEELEELVRMGILSTEKYGFLIKQPVAASLSDDEKAVLGCAAEGRLNIDLLKSDRGLKLKKVNIGKAIGGLLAKGAIACTEVRYDFKNTKISTGLGGVNRVFLPSSNIFPTLVASDSNDFIALKDVNAADADGFKAAFIKEVYQKGLFRKISKEEACMAQGFPKNFLLPDARARWMKLLGNSVSVPVIEGLGRAVAATGVFGKNLLLENSPSRAAAAKPVG